MTNSISIISRDRVSVVNHVLKLLQDDKLVKKKIFWLLSLQPRISPVFIGTACWNWNGAVLGNHWGKE